MTANHPAIRTLACALALLGACDPEPPPIAVSTEHFDIAPSFAAEVCAGNLEHVEARLAWLEQALGLQATTKIRFNWYEDGNPSCDGGSACVHGWTIDSDWDSFDHELVHALLSQLGRAHPFLEEGMAVAFTSGLGVDPSPPSRWLDDTPRDVDDGHVGEFYAAAGHFIRYMHDTHGVERLLALYRRSNYDDGPSGFRADIEAVYGRPFADIEAEYLEASALSYPPLQGCPEPTLERGDAGHDEHVVLDCDDPAVLRLAESWIGRLVTLELDEPTLGEFTVDGRRELRVDSCGPVRYERPPTVHMRLDPGSHSVLITTADDDAPRTVHVAFTPRG